jgi:flagellar basal-body rod protein FlgB
MIFDNMFVQNDLLGSAMQAAAVRNDVTINNITNADVPGFKKKAVKFESFLQEKLDSARSLTDIDFQSLSPTVQTEHKGYNYRLDENNVDIETEMAALYKNSAKYDTMAQGVINNYKRINLVLTGVK